MAKGAYVEKAEALYAEANSIVQTELEAHPRDAMSDEPKSDGEK